MKKKYSYSLIYHVSLLRVSANEINTTKLPIYSMTLAWFSGSVSVCHCRGMTKNMSSNLTNYYYFFFFYFCCFLFLRNNYSLIIYNSVIQLSKVKKSKQDMTPCNIVSIFASQGLRFGSPFSPPLADLDYILRIRTLIFHWLRLPVHVSNQKTFYMEHMLSTKCKQRWHRNALIWQRFATSRYGSNENIFPVCQSFETFT
jgi:hypothetical protein